MNQHAPPAVTIVVPVFNKKPYLRETLQSLTGQTLAEIEIVCVDDGSTDCSIDILNDQASRDPRIRVFANKANLGPGPTRNRGLGEAMGRYVQFVDADDIVPPDAVRALYTRIVSDGVHAVKGNIEGFTEHGPDNRWILLPPVSEKQRFRFADSPDLWNPWFHVTWMFDRDFLMAHDVRYPDLRTGEDPVFLAQALAKTSWISTVGVLCYRYRIGTHKAHRILDLAWMLQHAEHAARVKDIFRSAGLPQCWNDSYAGFSLQDLQRMGSNAKLSPDDRRCFDERLASIYSDWPGWTARGEIPDRQGEHG